MTKFARSFPKKIQLIMRCMHMLFSYELSYYLLISSFKHLNVLRILLFLNCEENASIGNSI